VRKNYPDFRVSRPWTTNFSTRRFSSVHHLVPLSRLHTFLPPCILYVITAGTQRVRGFPLLSGWLCWYCIAFPAAVCEARVVAVPSLRDNVPVIISMWHLMLFVTSKETTVIDMARVLHSPVTTVRSILKRAQEIEIKAC
jgi:hypothetical protein